MKTGIIVDLETTGLDPKKDKIIEIGLLKFSLDEGHSAYYLNSYSELEDPKQPLDPFIEKLTGLTNKVLESQSINWNWVKKELQEASFVVAHNMPFDRSFLLEVDCLKDLKIHWTCSVKHIDWRRMGFKTRALNYLACDHGFVNPFPHRALFDCATTFKLIAPHCKELLERSMESEYELSAVNAPFSSKDLLKGRGYHWSPEKKVWSKTVFESERKEESAFLAEKIYGGKSAFEEIKIK